MGSRIGIIHLDGLHFYKGLRGGNETRLNNEVDGTGLWVDALT